MACKRSAVRSRLAPPDQTIDLIQRFLCGFRTSECSFASGQHPGSTEARFPVAIEAVPSASPSRADLAQTRRRLSLGPRADIVISDA